VQFFRSSRAKNALEVSNSRVRDWQLMCGVITGFLILSMVISCSRQNDITVYMPPDLSSGATFKAGTVPKTSVYMFASEVWRSVNNWEKNGDEDMKNNLTAYSSYLSEGVLQEQLALHEKRVQTGNSTDRVRRMNEITELKDVEAAVSTLGAGTWDVDLDLRLRESLKGTIVKDQPLRYRLRVATDNSDPLHNPFHMRVIAVSQPFRIEFEGDGKSDEGGVQ
jgi:integrating conjugative element protein (TIGR03746 family)